MKSERVIGLGALLMALGIGIGALGAHALREVLSARQLESLDTAVDYQLVNALGLILIGMLLRTHPGLRWPARLLAAGITCFSGGIYLMLAGAPGLFGLITPAGGVLLIVAWVSASVQLLTRR